MAVDFKTLVMCMLSAFLSLAACTPSVSPASVEPTPPSPPVAEPGRIQPAPTRILDADAADRLANNSGVTLQWVSWDYRGNALVTVDGATGIWHLSASQTVRGTDKGGLSVAGRITEIGSDYFIFDGRIAITDTPDLGRRCVADKQWRFAITQNRKYYRLREFEWCDGLTDYIDIYF